ncbi:unnamed protein product [Blepharisma stoltei]|uniref:Uncharacterized protein n=1 Tax=Blepharisma stoltei TaxID=1481888 RepID=A0AAU9JWC9_9CILI|nr:unnamed protein product [Blepharisma stoltei]
MILCSWRYEEMAWSWIGGGRLEEVKALDKSIKQYHMEVLRERAAGAARLRRTQELKQSRITNWLKLDP